MRIKTKCTTDICLAFTVLAIITHHPFGCNASSKKSCSYITDLSNMANVGNICGEFETCHQINDSLSDGYCECKAGYVRIWNHTCQYVETTLPPPHIPNPAKNVDDRGGHEATNDLSFANRALSLVISTMLILVLIGGACGVLYYADKRYNLMGHVQNRIHAMRVRQRSAGQPSTYDEMLDRVL